jgi:hypothetical protein
MAKAMVSVGAMPCKGHEPTVMALAPSEIFFCSSLRYVVLCDKISLAPRYRSEVEVHLVF